MIIEGNYKSYKHTFDSLKNKKHKYVIKSRKDFKRIKRKITKYLHKNGDSYVEYHRAVGNSFRHGELPVKVRLYQEYDGSSFVSIKDSGNGFDVSEIIRKFKAGKKYYHNHGSGTRTIVNSKHVSAFWNHEGNRISLVIK